jgi:hypothetical protein
LDVLLVVFFDVFALVGLLIWHGRGSVPTTVVSKFGSESSATIFLLSKIDSALAFFCDPTSGSSGKSGLPIKSLSNALLTAKSLSTTGIVKACKLNESINNFLAIEYIINYNINFEFPEYLY